MLALLVSMVNPLKFSGRPPLLRCPEGTLVMGVGAADLGPTGGPSLDARGNLCCALVVVDFDHRFNAIGHVLKRHTVLDMQDMNAVRELHQNADDHENVHAD